MTPYVVCISKQVCVLGWPKFVWKNTKSSVHSDIPEIMKGDIILNASTKFQPPTMRGTGCATAKCVHDLQTNLKNFYFSIAMIRIQMVALFTPLSSM